MKLFILLAFAFALHAQDNHQTLEGTAPNASNQPTVAPAPKAAKSAPAPPIADADWAPFSKLWLKYISAREAKTQADAMAATATRNLEELQAKVEPALADLRAKHDIPKECVPTFEGTWYKPEGAKLAPCMIPSAEKK